MHVMLPLRFSGSGIRAMIFVRKIGFKLRVMRLNRARPPTRGWSAVARACPQGRPTSLAGASARKGGRRRSWGQHPAGATVACGHTCLQRDARKGGRLQGARKGLSPVASPAASKGDSADHRGGYPLVGWMPTGKGNRRLRRGSSGDGGTDGARGIRASF
ncbi:hypothetical protein GW17_00046871 [Ensete ventricosum]|nr:hypothetical protein GW17_00046871 [Ensete ventricosum]